MLQVWLYFIFSQQYHIMFQHEPALKSTLVTSAALLWCSGISQLPPFPSCGRLQPQLAMAGHRAHLFPLPYVATTSSPLSVTWHHGRKKTPCANFPVCAHLCPLSSAWPHFPHTLSELAHGEGKAGSSSYVQSPGKPLPHRVLFTFPIVSLMAFQSRLKNLSLTAETNQGI